MSLSIKLVFANEIHRLTSLPPTYSALQQYCSSLFHYPSFIITYRDEEGDTITIACDSDLQTSYSSAPPSQSLRFILSLPGTSPEYSNPQSRPERCSSTSSASSRQNYSQESQPTVWPLHTCDGCDTKPIIGSRFHCTVCPDFDFCENCEKSHQHDHPFMKFATRTEDVYVNIDFTPENLMDSLVKVKNFYKAQKPKMKVIGNPSFYNTEEGGVVIRWTVLNCGNCIWPEDCEMVSCKGNLDVLSYQIPELAPGQEGEIVVQAVCKTLEFNGKWKIVAKNGIKLGKVKAGGQLFNIENKKISGLIEMGFDRSLIESILIETKGDLEKAIQLLFS
jgi:hypothetical protein